MEILNKLADLYARATGQSLPLDPVRLAHRPDQVLDAFSEPLQKGHPCRAFACTYMIYSAASTLLIEPADMPDCLAKTRIAEKLVRRLESQRLRRARRTSHALA